MSQPIDQYWQIRLKTLQKNLIANGFDAVVAETVELAGHLVLEKILPETAARSISWGGSMTFTGSGLYDSLKQRQDLTVIDTYDKQVPPEEVMARRRQALLADLFVTGTNAVTENGHLVNLDMIGNRVAALTFGPRNVLVLVGRNKLVADLAAARERIKNYTAPVNVIRLDKKTPCAKTGRCEDCKSPDRICNTWTITEKSFPKGRIKVVLINADLGF